MSHTQARVPLSARGSRWSLGKRREEQRCRASMRCLRFVDGAQSLQDSGERLDLLIVLVGLIERGLRAHAKQGGAGRQGSMLATCWQPLVTSLNSDVA